MLAQTSFSRRVAISGVLALSALASACGGGGGGTTPTTNVDPNNPIASQSCGATSSTTGAGYVIGACAVGVKQSDGSTIEKTTSQFQEALFSVGVDQTVTAVPDPATGLNYTFSITLPVGSGSATFSPTAKTCSGNQIGDRTGYITQVFADPTATETSPRYTLLSFAKASEIIDPNAKILNGSCIPNPTALKEIGTLTRVSDFGVWERYIGGAAIYYGGWYATRGATHTAPTAAKTYTEGSVVGYRFTQELIYGMSAKVVAGAKWDGAKLVAQINNYKYSRKPLVNPSVEPAYTDLTLTSNKIENNKVSGVVEGTPGSGISGVFEGVFAGSGGEEVVGRIRFTQASSDHKFVGSFAIK
jgi:hypothetical protein